MPENTVFTKVRIDNDLTVAGAAAVTGNATVSGTLAVTGAASLTVPLTKANVNNSVKREVVMLSFDGTLTDGSTNRRSIVMTRAGRVVGIRVAARVKAVGGTNTLALARIRAGASVNLISTATVDPTAVPAAADTGEAMTLTATTADLNFAANDILRATLVCGTMTTDGADYAVALEVEYDDE